VGGCRAALANGRVDAYAVKFIPQAVAGGVLWATGNTMAVPVISSIGLGMGMLIWGTTNMLMGWATGMARLDRNSASPGLVWLNVTGVGLALLALALYTLIRPDAAKEQPAAMRDELLLQAGSAGGGVLGAGAAIWTRAPRDAAGGSPASCWRSSRGSSTGITSPRPTCCSTRVRAPAMRSTTSSRISAASTSHQRSGCAHALT